MIGNIVARRYASALFSLGKGKGLDELQAYGKGLSDLAAMFEAAPELVRIFRNPIISLEEKKALAGKLLGETEPNPMLTNFINLLADKDRLPELPDIEASFKEMLDAEQGLLRGGVVTAVKLSEPKQAELAKKLEAQTGKKLALDYEVDPSILGGLVLKVGDRVLDASLKAQLGMMQEQIKRGE